MVFIVIRVKVIYFGIFCIVTVFIGGPLEKRFLPKGNPPKINQINQSINRNKELQGSADPKV